MQSWVIFKSKQGKLPSYFVSRLKSGIFKRKQTFTLKTAVAREPEREHKTLSEYCYHRFEEEHSSTAEENTYYFIKYVLFIYLLTISFCIKCIIIVLILNSSFPVSSHPPIPPHRSISHFYVFSFFFFNPLRQISAA